MYMVGMSMHYNEFFRNFLCTLEENRPVYTNQATCNISLATMALVKDSCATTLRKGTSR